MATRRVIGSLHRRHRAVEFTKFLIRIDEEVPDGLDVHLILDNYATHKTPDVQRWRCAIPLPSAVHAHLRIVAEHGIGLPAFEGRSPPGGLSIHQGPPAGSDTRS
jgi:hypothetical protein